MKRVVSVLVVIILLATCACRSKDTGSFERFLFVGAVEDVVGKIPSPFSVLCDGTPAKVKVVGISDENYKIDEIIYSFYYIKVIDDYNGGKYLSYDDTYTIMFVGTEDVQLYRQPPLNIGEEYFVINIKKYNNPKQIIAATFWFEIRTCDGEEYIYPYRLDCSDVKCAERPDKNEDVVIYKSKDIKRYLKRNRIDNPKFEWKLKLKSFYKEFESFKSN